MLENKVWQPFKKAFLSIILISISFYACQKGDEVQLESSFSHAFAKLPENADSRITQFADSLLVAEVRKPWMDSIMGTLGSPGWEHASFGTQNGQPAVMVPLIAPSGKEINGLLVMAVMGDRFRYRIIDARKPDRYGYDNGRNRANARSIFIAADLFKQRVLGRKPGPITDPCLMTRSERSQFEQARRSGDAGHMMVKVMAYALSITCYTTMACTGDGQGNCVGNVTYSTNCVYNYIWIDNYAEGGDGYGSGGSSSSGGGGSGQSGPNIPSTGCQGIPDNGSGLAVVLPPKKPILDIKEYLKCFSRTAGATITYYADQPVTGSSQYISFMELVGHAYLAIEQNVGGNIIRRTVGFHPAEATTPVFTNSAPSIYGDDANAQYDVKYSVNVSAETIKKVLAFIEKPNPMYHIEKYNCTNFVLDVSDICGLKIPRNKGEWLFGSGLNPGQFGEDLRRIPGAVFGKRTSPGNLGKCN